MAKKLQSPLALGLVVALSITLCACATTVRPLSASAQLDGYLARDVIIIVPEPFTWNVRLGVHTLPAGTYLPVFEDDEGVYYQSSGKLLINIFGVSSSFHDGGLYFKRGDLNDCYEYLTSPSSHVEHKLPNDFKFTIETKQR